LLSIGGTEIMHFQTWQDKAGNAPPLTDPTNGLVFPDLNADGLFIGQSPDFFDVLNQLAQAADHARHGG
jgi:hypothetical protein